MRCPVCRRDHTKVLDSREGTEDAIRRRRVCADCGHRFTTRERVDETLPTITKRDGSKQPFDRDKLLRGLKLACRKRPVDVADLDEVIRHVEQWASSRGDKEISSDELGERVMAHLHALDDVAYVRFVSVYRSFSTIAEFASLLSEIEKAQVSDLEGQGTLFDSLPSAHGAEAAKTMASVHLVEKAIRRGKSKDGGELRKGDRRKKAVPKNTPSPDSNSSK